MSVNSLNRGGVLNMNFKNSSSQGAGMAWIDGQKNDFNRAHFLKCVQKSERDR
jgi:hypothetical protein